MTEVATLLMRVLQESESKEKTFDSDEDRKHFSHSEELDSKGRC